MMPCMEQVEKLYQHYFQKLRYCIVLTIPVLMGTAPEPIHRNLIEFSELIREGGQIDCGLATDGDADRIGLYNAKGQFIDSHHIILLLIHYLVKYKGMSGKRLLLPFHVR